MPRSYRQATRTIRRTKNGRRHTEDDTTGNQNAAEILLGTLQCIQEIRQRFFIRRRTVKQTIEEVGERSLHTDRFPNGKLQ